jgi:hypothetical protein
MARNVGRSYPVSPFRRLVVDLMWASAKVPSVTIERKMNLGALASARRCCPVRPGWGIIIAKAFSLLGRRYPELRRSYMTFPWPRLYEHPSSTAALNIERTIDGEAVVLQCLIRRPDNRSLLDLERIVRWNRETPLEQLRWYQRALIMSRLPWPLRRFVWWGSLNIFGRQRTHNYGTFGLTSVAAQGAGVLKIIPLLTSTLHYTLFDAAWNLEMRLSFDHRVLDGALAARILVDLEHTLHGEILTELHGMCGAMAA